MAEAGQFGNPQFELTGGALCLDFANTSPDHKAPETSSEKIHTYAELLTFEVQAGALPVTDARNLLAAASHANGKGAAVTRSARELREILYRIFAAAASERKPSREDVEAFNRFLGEALRHTRLVPNSPAFKREWDDPASLQRPLWPIVSSAAELMTGEQFGFVRQCESERCSWLFIDRSRNRTRRWCNMKVCGNRAKARRHYQRVKD